MGYSVFGLYRKPVLRMPSIPEHEEVSAVNDVWDNEFRMLERMSQMDDCSGSNYDFMENDFGPFMNNNLTISTYTCLNDDDEDDFEDTKCFSIAELEDVSECDQDLQVLLAAMDKENDRRNCRAPEGEVDEEEEEEEDSIIVGVPSPTRCTGQVNRMLVLSGPNCLDVEADS